MNTVTLNMHIAMSYAGLTRQNTVFVFWLLRPRNMYSVLFARAPVLGLCYFVSVNTYSTRRVLCGSHVWPSPPVVGPLRGPSLCVGPLWVGSSPVVFPFPVASVPRLASRSRSRSRSRTRPCGGKVPYWTSYRYRE